ncbi:MAG: signal peptidase II [Smithellaceae bacterium]|nr:signal peptidase II [Smithellaceae bacterium]
MEAQMRAYATFAATVLVIVVLDQITKSLVLANLMLHETRVLVEGFINLVHVRNPGAAFGFLADAPELFRRFFFIIITVLVIIFVLFYFWHSRIYAVRPTIALALILAGGAGNLIDRIRFGEVVDFLDVYLGIYHWPAFNVADSAISVGAVLLLLDLLRGGKAEG